MPEEKCIAQAIQAARFGNGEDLYKALFPEILTSRQDGWLMPKTLTALGLKTHPQAIAEGHVLVRPKVACTQGRKALPALWIAVDDMPQIEGVCQAVGAIRLDLAAKKRADQAAKSAITREHLLTALSERVEPGLLANAPVQAMLVRACANGASLSKAFSRLYIHLSKDRWRNPNPRWTFRDISDWVFVSLHENDKVLSFKLPMSTCCAAMLQDDYRILETAIQRERIAIDARLQALHKKLQEDHPFGPPASDVMRAEDWDALLHTAIDGVPWATRSCGSEAELYRRASNRVEPLLRDEVQAQTARRCREALPSKLEDFYPVARSLNRKLILVIGPTNSGKTYRALERLKTAASGVYLGPLRLLALEVRDTLQGQGFPTSLVTGELLDIQPGANFTSSTIEMLDFEEEREIGIVDEVQMLGDPQRGSAWLAAVLGAPVRELWMLGSPESRDAVIALAAQLGEPLEIIETERLTPLTVAPGYSPLSDVPAGSAVVAFSRRAVMAIAAELKTYGRRPAIVYGALSPEVRAEQARRFRDGQADVVVATDAIGMGLNLPVEKLFFSTSVKWNGTSEEHLSRELAWQIAGRAGRYGLAEAGIVSALDKKTLDGVRNLLAQRPPPVPTAFSYGPTWPVVSAIQRYLESDKLQGLLRFFNAKLQLSSDYRFRPLLGESQLILAAALDQLPIPLRDKLQLSFAPVPMLKKVPDPVFAKLVRAIAKNKPITINGAGIPRKCDKLEDAERAVKNFNLYAWLHYRYPDIFQDLELVQACISSLNANIVKMLAATKVAKCTCCRKPLHWRHPFPTCESCFRSRHSYDY